jgi:hypothetical protein
LNSDTVMENIDGASVTTNSSGDATVLNETAG